MSAALASLRTASQPVTTTGEKAMTSTFCLMKDRIAAIWFSCFCWASENFRSTPAAFAASWIDLVLAVRQPDSAPTWEKPRTSLPDPEPEPSSPEPQALRAVSASEAPATATMSRLSMGSSFFLGGSAKGVWGGVRGPADVSGNIRSRGRDPAEAGLSVARVTNVCANSPPCQSPRGLSGPDRGP